MYIDGQWIDAIDGETFAVTDPATGAHLSDVPDGGRADAEAAIAAADAAFGSWSSTTAHERADLL
ncbi:MAG: aldehyde dehydrogenase family protein, partial [Actinomycetota bacterium]